MRQWMMVLVMLLVSLPGGAAAGEVIELEGTWLEGTSEEDVAVREASVEMAARSYPAPLRPIVRRRVLSQLRVTPRLFVDVDGEHITIGGEGRPTYRTRWDGSQIAAEDAQGRAMTLARNWTGERLEVVAVSPVLTQNVGLSVSPDGQQLTMEVEVQSDKLSTPLRFRLSYQRVTSSGGDAAQPEP